MWSHIHPYILTSFLDGLKGSGPLSISEGTSTIHGTKTQQIMGVGKEQ